MDILPTPLLAQAIPPDGSASPSGDGTGDDPFLALLAALLQPQLPPPVGLVLPPDKGASDLATLPAHGAAPAALPPKLVEAPVKVSAAQPAGVPPMPEPDRAQLDTPTVTGPTDAVLSQRARPSTAEREAEIAKQGRKGRIAEPEPHERPRARPAVMDIASQTNDPRTWTDASPEPSTQVRAAILESSPPERDTSDPAPPRLPDVPPSASPAQVRAPALLDPPLAGRPPVAAHPVTLPSPDHRGRVVSARLVVAQDDGGSSLRIDLEPADLGRVEVALRMDDAGLASATFTVDRPETLQLLQRDARTVGELLGSAGFAVQQGALGFTLRDSPGGQHGSERGERGGRAGSARDGSAIPSGQLLRRDGLLDLRV